MTDIDIATRFGRTPIGRRLENRKDQIGEWLGERTHHMWVRQLPNAITTFRLTAVIPALRVSGLINQRRFGAAASMIILAGLITALDILDGRLARRLDKSSKRLGNPTVVSKYGKLADPLADKAVGIPFLLCFPGILRITTHHLPTSLIMLSRFAAVCMVAIELSLIVIALYSVILGMSRKLVAHTAPVFEQQGANNWGKLKFNLEAYAILFGYLSWLRLADSQSNWLSPVIFSGFIAASAFCGLQSVRGHIAQHHSQTHS